MAFARPHSTSADATFSATGAAAWNANQTPTGADVGGIPYCPTATTETTSAKMVFDGTTFTLAMGSVTASPGAVLLSQTRNAAGTTFDGIIKAVITDTASASGSLAMQILGGASGTSSLIKTDKAAITTLGQAGTLSGSLVIGQAGSVNNFISFGGTANQTLYGNTNAVGIHWQLITDSTGSGGAPNFKLNSVGLIGWNSGTNLASGSLDVGLSRSAAGVLQLNTGTAAAGAALEGFEQTAPSAPAANGYRIFAQDNGGGKTQLMVIFNSGAAQQIAIEP